MMHAPSCVPPRMFFILFLMSYYNEPVVLKQLRIFMYVILYLFIYIYISFAHKWKRRSQGVNTTSSHSIIVWTTSSICLYSSIIFSHVTVSVYKIFCRIYQIRYSHSIVTSFTYIILLLMKHTAEDNKHSRPLDYGDSTNNVFRALFAYYIRVLQQR